MAPAGATRAVLAALALAAAWAGCGGDGEGRCDEALGYVCQKGAAGSGAGGAAPGGAAGTGGTGAIGGTAGLGGAGAGGGNGSAGGLACGALEVVCDGACVNVKASDADHCGACGRSCRGSTCEAGACVPEAMTAAGEVAPYALADDGTYLYWVSPAAKAGVASRLRRAPKATPGGAGEAVFPNVEARARALAFAGGKLYWGELAANGIFSGAPGLAFPDASPFAADQLDVRCLVVATGKAFWSLGGDSAVRGKPLAGGALAPDVLGQANPAWVAADEAGASYWVAGVTREVRRAKAAAPGYEAFATGAGIVAVELAGDAVSWADAAAGVIRSAPKTATPPAAGIVAFEGRGRVEGFRLEGTTLYVVTLQAGALAVWRKAEGDAEPFLLGRVPAKAAGYAGNPFGAAYVLTDAQYLYFADVGTVDTSPDVDTSAGDGVVYRVAK
ncbi:MAG TPA: hypothetical protein VFS00_05035 [Polyangiaceae bacterium]|nr:hypothetical protein [Polyangiaceae bacterium]